MEQCPTVGPNQPLDKPRRAAEIPPDRQLPQHPPFRRRPQRQFLIGQGGQQDEQALIAHELGAQLR